MGTTSHTMKAAIFLLVGVSAAVLVSGSPLNEPKFACHECTDEMKKLGWMVKEAGHDISAYLQDNYCPTIEDQELCEENIGRFYLACCSLSSTTFLLMELFMFARQWEFVAQEDIPAM